MTMRPDLWVIWIAFSVLCCAVSGSIGSRFFPSQIRLDAEWQDGVKQGRADERARAMACPSCGCDPWEGDPDDRRSHERHCPLGPRARGINQATRPDEPEPRWDDTAENLALLAGPYYEPLARDAEPDNVVHDALSGNRPAPVPGPEFPTSPIYDQLAAGPGADPWERLAADLDDDPDISEWSAKADAARCSEIVRELRQLREALEVS